MAKTLYSRPYSSGFKEIKIEMNYNNPMYKRIVYITHSVCTLLFLIFWFCYLYCVQGTLLSIAQHVFSGGKTTYSPFWGAVIICILLWLLQIGVNKVLRLQSLCFALSFFPSCLILAMITDIDPGIFREFSIGGWAWAFPLLLIVFAGVVSLVKHLRMPEDFKGTGIFFSLLLPNLIFTVFFCFCVGATGNTTDTLQYTYQVEKALTANKPDKALEIGSKSLATSPMLTALRAYALSLTGQMGEKLFTYPQPYGANGLIIMPSDTLGLSFRAEKVYLYLGVHPVKSDEPVMDYLEQVIKSPGMKAPAHDYYLCALLLNKKLSRFAEVLPHYYKLDENLPVHYKEALVLYSRITRHPEYIFHDSVEDASYEDFLQLENSYKYYEVRRNYIHREFGSTYWFYFKYVALPS